MPFVRRTVFSFLLYNKTESKYHYKGASTQRRGEGGGRGGVGGGGGRGGGLQSDTIKKLSSTH